MQKQEAFAMLFATSVYLISQNWKNVLFMAYEKQMLKMLNIENIKN